jgi:hypothetical protein
MIATDEGAILRDQILLGNRRAIFERPPPQRTLNTRVIFIITDDFGGLRRLLGEIVAVIETEQGSSPVTDSESSWMLAKGLDALSSALAGKRKWPSEEVRKFS